MSGLTVVRDGGLVARGLVPALDAFGRHLLKIHARLTGFVTGRSESAIELHLRLRKAFPAELRNRGLLLEEFLFDYLVWQVVLLHPFDRCLIPFNHLFAVPTPLYFTSALV